MSQAENETMLELVWTNQNLTKAKQFGRKMKQRTHCEKQCKSGRAVSACADDDRILFNACAELHSALILYSSSRSRLDGKRYACVIISLKPIAIVVAVGIFNVTLFVSFGLLDLPMAIILLFLMTNWISFPPNSHLFSYFFRVKSSAPPPRVWVITY